MIRTHWPGQPVDLAGQPAGLRARVVAPSAKSPRPMLEALVVDRCALGWWEPGRLARLIGRNPSDLRGTVIMPIVERGELALAHPERKHHPRQQYGAPILPRREEDA